MVNKKFWLGILVLTLVFGMTVVGCEEESDDPPPTTYTPQPGDLVSNPIDRIESIALGTMTLSDSGWRKLLSSIESTGKYVNLDLSACTMTGTSFDPVASVSTGKDLIISLILPTAATSIVDGNYQNSAFKNFIYLKYIKGANIITIGDNSFYDPVLESVDFPKATTIGESAFFLAYLKTVNFPQVTIIGEEAFKSCRYLQSASFPLVTTVGEGAFYFCEDLMALNIPKVSSIGYATFGYTGDTELSITMGSSAPTLGKDIFRGTETIKTVRVKIPTGATGYTPAASPFTGTSVTVSGTNVDENWANGFRGAGWNGHNFTNDVLNPNISLSIERQ